MQGCYFEKSGNNIDAQILALDVFLDIGNGCVFPGRPVGLEQCCFDAAIFGKLPARSHGDDLKISIRFFLRLIEQGCLLRRVFGGGSNPVFHTDKHGCFKRHDSG